MEIQELTEFHLKITLIREAIAKKVIWPHILSIFDSFFDPNYVQNIQMLNNVLIL